jgi:hypothetical protein
MFVRIAVVIIIIIIDTTMLDSTVTASTSTTISINIIIIVHIINIPIIISIFGVMNIDVSFLTSIIIVIMLFTVDSVVMVTWCTGSRTPAGTCT